MNNNATAELTRLAVAAREALTDNMVERLSVTGANALEVVDRLNDEDTRDAVSYLLDRLTEAHRTGALATLFDTLGVLHAAREASTDSIVERLFAFVEHTINTVGSEEFSTLVDDAHASLADAAAEASAAPPKGGLMATISLLSDPETQRNLRFLMSFSGRLRERTAGGNGG
jgi:uncharacterized protein YjgD (DUF1641 family)